MANYDEMFLPLYKNNLIDLDGVNEEKINKISFGKLLNIYDEVSESVATLPNKDNISGRIFTSSNSLSGSPLECSELDCRVRRVDELGKFASLFADHILWHNFLSDISPSLGHPPRADSHGFRYRVLADMHVLLKLKDLIDVGIIKPYTVPHGYCANCFSKRFLGENTSDALSQAKTNLLNDIKNSLSLSLRYIDDDNYLIKYSGDDAYIPHGGAVIIYTRDEIEKILPLDIINNLKPDQDVKLPNKIYKNLNIPKFLSHSLTTEAIYQKSIAKITGSSILTHSMGEINAIKRIEGNDYIRSINNLLLEHWKIIIPFAQNLSSSDILELRLKEPEAFISFRSSLDKSLSEAFSMKENFSSKDARDIYASIIQPNLTILERKTKQATKSLFKKPIMTAAGVTATLGLGAASGLLSHDLTTALNALGISKIVYDTITNAMNSYNVESGIQDENYYFLWKMSKLA